MSWLLDSNVLIALRDGDAAIAARLLDLDSRPMISIISLIELENGVVRDPTRSVERRQALARLTEEFDILDFRIAEARIYRRIVTDTGFNRGRTLDRMIAATAMQAGATLVTANVRDFRDIAGLQIEDWSD